MKIQTKLLLGLAVVPVLLLLLIGGSWRQVVHLTSMSAVLEEQYEVSFLAGQIHRTIKDEAIALRNAVIFTDASSVQREIEWLEAEDETVERDLALLATLVNTTEEREMVAEVSRINRQFRDYKLEVFALLAEGDRETALQRIDSDSDRIHEAFLQAITALNEHVEQQMDASLQEAPREFRRDLIVGSLISILGVIAVIGAIFRSAWKVAARLNHMASVMTDVADGRADLTTRIETANRDEIDAVAHSFNRMAQALRVQTEKEKDEHWLKSNSAEITAALTATHDLGVFAQRFLSKAAPLVNAAHAVFYIMHEDERTQDPELRLMASYAFKERKHPSSAFRIGEGLVGQAAFEKTPILLTSVPSDYVTIRSGLGEAPPLNVYVLPIQFEDEVSGVVEFASFQPFSPIQQAFLEEMVNHLGIILDSLRGRIRLAALLEESQAMTEELQTQSEELQSQQEELRSINEELEEQALALRQSEEKLQAQQEELEQTNEELKEKALSLEYQNKRFEATNKEMEIARLELEEKARQLALSSKYKSEFLANMSHELRTPLNSLLILSKLLADNTGGNLTEKQIEYAKTIHSSGSDLLSLINDILDLAKIESGKMDAVPNAVSIADVADFAEKSFRPLANEKQLQFRIVVEEGLPETIHSDERRLQQVIRNLLSNAFKFTHQGGVELSIRRAEGPGGKPMLAFSVSDSGIGIPKEKQELIFQAFQQADGTTSRKYGGTGLGLSICREIATLLGGSIEVKSEEGEGSVFTFRVGDFEETPPSALSGPLVDEAAATSEPPPTAGLPTKASVETAPPRTTEPPSLPSVAARPGDGIKRLLIVDDDVRQRNSLMELIGELDVVMTAVPTGKDALEQLKVNQFDGMVLDLGLSDTTGFALLEKINTDRIGRQLKVFVYTGRHLSSKEEIQLKKYTHTIIIKDAHAPQRLLDELRLFLSSSSAEPELAASSEPAEIPVHAELEGKRILIIDDDVRNVFALSSVLETYGMSVAFAENGSEGLGMLESDEPFDLVLTDIMMPEMDGYETIARLRRMPGFERLPVIAVTAKAMRDDREKCMEVGASDYIVKPVEPDQLISLVRVWLYPDESAQR